MAKVFMNDVNEYPMNVIAENFATTKVGATKLNEPDDEEEDEKQVQEGSFQVTGTTWEKRPDIFDDKDMFEPPKDVKVVKGCTAEELLAIWMDQDVIIYNIGDSVRQSEQASEAITALHEKIGDIDHKITFVGVTNCLTWARTKPDDPEEPDVPFTEDNYRRRKPHGNYKNQSSTEKLILKYGKTDKNKLSTYVVTAGLLYGKGEKVFHGFFKDAWFGVPQLKTIGLGEGNLPTIHVLDLSCVLRHIADNSISTRFIIAIDESQCTQQEIVQAISENVGSSKVEKGPKDNSILRPIVTQMDVDQLMLDLRLEGTCIQDSMNIDWVCASGMVENIKAVVREYRVARNLIPIRACILGPPGVGKSTLAKKLCEEYKVNHVHAKRVIEDNFQLLQRSIARVNEEGHDEDDEEEAQLCREKLQALEEAKEENNGRYGEEHIMGFFKTVLTLPPCKNQGFILDGYCKTTEQAETMFARDPDDEEEEDEDDDGLSYNKDIMPDVVFVLEASDEFLKERVMHLPESIVQESNHYTEEKFTAKLEEYRRLNADDVTIANYFDELEVHPVTINVEIAPSVNNLEPVLKKIREKIGKPRNYGLTAEARQEKDRLEKEAEESRHRREAEIREKLAREDAIALRQERAKWAAVYADVLREEEEKEAERAGPMRDYLMKNVMPALMSAMVQANQVRPADPVDFIAEYLFKHSEDLVETTRRPKQ